MIGAREHERSPTGRLPFVWRPWPLLDALGGPTRRATHLTRTIQGVTSVAVATGPNGRDEALRMTHDHAQTLLTSLTDAPR